MCRFYNGNSEYGEILEVIVRIKEGFPFKLNSETVSVISSKHGDLTISNDFDGFGYKGLYFTKKIDAYTKTEIIDAVKNDKITISIIGNKFKYLAPIFEDE